MRRSVELTTGAAPAPGAMLIAPRPFGHWDQVLRTFSAMGAEQVACVTAANSRQEAVLLVPRDGAGHADL